MPAVFGVSSFFMIRVRWDSTVLALIPRSLAASFVVLPSATSCSTSRSRDVSGSAGTDHLRRRPTTSYGRSQCPNYRLADRNLWHDQRRDPGPLVVSMDPYI